MNTPKTTEQIENQDIQENKTTNTDNPELVDVLDENNGSNNYWSILNDKEIVALKEQIPQDEEFEKYFDSLVKGTWFNKGKLDDLYENFIFKKVEEVLQKIEASSYSAEKLNSLLWEETLQKMQQIKWKINSITQGTLTIEEEIKQLWLSEKQTAWIKNVFKKIWWFLKMWKKTFSENIKEIILWTENKFAELSGLKPEVDQIVQDIIKAEKNLTESAHEYYKTYIALSFVELAYSNFLDNLQTGKTDFEKAKNQKESFMIKNKINKIKTSKVFLETVSTNHIKLSEKVDLIADNLEREYQEAMFVLALTIDSLISQEKIRQWVDLSNLLQDLKNSTISSYMESSRTFNDSITKSFESSIQTAKILAEEIKLLSKNINENENRISQIENESKKEIEKMRKASEELKKLWLNKGN